MYTSLYRTILCFVLLAVLVGCNDSGGSESGSMLNAVIPGTNVPTNVAGVFSGTLNLTATAAGISVSDSSPITITVSENGMVQFDGDDPDETFTANLQDAGVFSGSFSLDQVGCTGTVATEAQVSENTVTGTISGDGVCTVDGVTLDVTISGDFNATRS